MDVRSVPRDVSDFQQPLTHDQLSTLCNRAFPGEAPVVEACELLGGRYNTTYRLNRADGPPLILRVAPEQSRQSHLEYQLMRNEYASVPLLSAVGHLMPTVIRADFTHSIVGRDYLIQSYLPGVPAAQALNQYTAEDQLHFWFQLGEILAAIHAQKGTHFGPVNGDQHESWTASLTATFHAIAADMDRANLDPLDIAQLLQQIDVHASAIDECAEPRLLHGDLWVGNVMLATESETPRIVGIFDCDRTNWGDPDADWTLFLLTRRSAEVQEAFSRGYGGTREVSSGKGVRALLYQARSIAEARLEYRRLREDQHLGGTYTEMEAVLAQLR